MQTNVDTQPRNDAPYLRQGCRNGSIPCVRSGRTFYVNVPALLHQLCKGGDNQ